MPAGCARIGRRQPHEFTLAEEYRCAVLYPEQSASSNPLRCWNWFESASLEGQGEAA
jgi:poly(3-hydroxybutyrate) depolymerase